MAKVHLGNLAIEQNTLEAIIGVFMFVLVPLGVVLFFIRPGTATRDTSPPSWEHRTSQISSETGVPIEIVRQRYSEEKLMRDAKQFERLRHVDY